MRLVAKTLTDLECQWIGMMIAYAGKIFSRNISNAGRRYDAANIDKKQRFAYNVKPIS